MDILDFCLYQYNFKKACPFNNSTCAHCPWSLDYRVAWRSRNFMVSIRNKIADFPVYYRFSEM